MDALAHPTSFEERDFRAKIAREIDAKAAAASAKIEELVLRVVVGIVRDELEHLPGWVVTLAGNLDADVQARIRELREERGATRGRARQGEARARGFRGISIA
jgi:hypothetical protein